MTRNSDPSMPVEKQLVASLTAACEAAKREIPGFLWLTHEGDSRLSPGSLHVVWVFDTQESLAHALETGQGKRMYGLTAEAFRQAAVPITAAEAHVSFDTEEACERHNAGNWQARLAMLRSFSR
ncbi:MAG: Fis family transcriptional regulator [Pseudoalteromonas distincta]